MSKVRDGTSYLTVSDFAMFQYRRRNTMTSLSDKQAEKLGFKDGLRRVKISHPGRRTIYPTVRLLKAIGAI